MQSQTPVREYYAGKNILLTGATGFLGRALLSKFLRDLPDSGTIYVLLREKKGKSVDQRLQHLLKTIDPVLSAAIEASPEILDRVKPIAGDLLLLGLGIDATDLEVLKREVHVVISCAADIAFHRPLESIIRSNVRAVAELFNIAKSCQHISAFVHVSTAYTNVEEDLNLEAVPDMAEDVSLLLQKVTIGTSEKELLALSPTLKHKLTSYAWSKALAEYWLKQHRGTLPVIILRPALITNALIDPVPGWVQGMAGAVGMLYAVARGSLSILPMHHDGIVNVVPVDSVTRATIAAAWWVTQKQNEQKGLPTVMYLESTSAHTPLRGGELFHHMRNNVEEFRCGTPLFRKLFSMPPYGSNSWKARWFAFHELPVRLMSPGYKRTRLLKLLKDFNVVMADFATVAKLKCFFVAKELTIMSKALEQDTELFDDMIPSIDWAKYARVSFKGMLRLI